MYKVGDRVIYGSQGYKARVIRAINNDDYTVEFEDKDLIPPQMNVAGDNLTLDLDLEDLDLEHYLDAWGGYYDDPAPTNSSVNCPRCGNKWSETWIGHKPFYDCLKCNLKKEDV